MIWLIGCNGMLGSDLRGFLTERGIEHVATDAEVDITSRDAIAEFLNGKNPEWIVNCAAYTAVDKAEDEPEKAWLLNAEAVRILAGAARKVGSSVLHISTDYVFAGNEDRELSEDDPVGPSSVYGRTKEAGERYLRELLPEHIIIRTAWLYGKNGRSFVATMLRLMNERKEIKVVDDQHGSPTNTKDLAGAIIAILNAEKKVWGTYHYTGSGKTTWYDFACEIQRIASARGLASSACSIKPIPSSEYPSKARRPNYSTLSMKKITGNFSISPGDWKPRLARYINEEL
jgi:dTDP-4-dehydrorhamnose reductase